MLDVTDEFRRIGRDQEPPLMFRARSMYALTVSLSDCGGGQYTYIIYIYIIIYVCLYAFISLSILAYMLNEVNTQWKGLHLTPLLPSSLLPSSLSLTSVITKPSLLAIN